MTAGVAMVACSTRITFLVPGLPKPAGSKRAFIVRAKNKRDRVAVVDSSGQAGKDWRAVVQLAAREAHVGPPLCGPLRFSAAFFLPRPKGHRGKRGIRSSAPAYPATRPDLLKLARLVEDALSGIVWADDAQIVLETLRKVYASAEGPGVLIEVEALG